MARTCSAKTASVRHYHRHSPAPRAKSYCALAPALENGHLGRLGRRASSLPESHPHRQPSHNHPSTPQPNPTRPKRPKGGGAFPSCRQPQRKPPPEDDAPRQGDRAGWFGMASSSVLTISLTHHLINLIHFSCNCRC
jgi:hypothetical protein